MGNLSQVVPFSDDERLRVLHVLGRFVVEAMRAPEKFQLATRSVANVERVATS